MITQISIKTDVTFKGFAARDEIKLKENIRIQTD